MTPVQLCCCWEDAAASCPSSGEGKYPRPCGGLPEYAAPGAGGAATSGEPVVCNRTATGLSAEFIDGLPSAVVSSSSASGALAPAPCSGIASPFTTGVMRFSFCRRLQNHTRTTSFSNCSSSESRAMSEADGLGCLIKCDSSTPFTVTCVHTHRLLIQTV